MNLGSPKQLQQVLFEELGMPKTKTIKTGYTTDADALADLYASTEHPFLEHCCCGTATRPGSRPDRSRLARTEVADDGRIHTTYNQTIAATGRSARHDPNLQNIPIRTDEGRRDPQGVRRSAPAISRR